MTLAQVHRRQQPHSDQATRRAIRTLGHPVQYRTTFVATEGELLAGDHRGMVWQQCGAGMGDNPPVKVVPDVSLNAIVNWTDRLLESSEADRRRHGFKKPEKPTPDPEALYPSHLRATMPEPAQQLESALSVQLAWSGRMLRIHKTVRGHIVVDSEVGRGTSFVIYFPRTEEASSYQATEDHKDHLTQGIEPVATLQ